MLYGEKAINPPPFLRRGLRISERENDPYKSLSDKESRWCDACRERRCGHAKWRESNEIQDDQPKGKSNERRPSRRRAQSPDTGIEVVVVDRIAVFTLRSLARRASGPTKVQVKQSGFC